MRGGYDRKMQMMYGQSLGRLYPVADFYLRVELDCLTPGNLLNCFLPTMSPGC